MDFCETLEQLKKPKTLDKITISKVGADSKAQQIISKHQALFDRLKNR